MLEMINSDHDLIKKKGWIKDSNRCEEKIIEKCRKLLYKYEIDNKNLKT